MGMNLVHQSTRMDRATADDGDLQGGDVVRWLPTVIRVAILVAFPPRSRCSFCAERQGEDYP